MAVFCSSLKSWPEAKVKRLRLIILASEITKQPFINPVFPKVHLHVEHFNEKEQAEEEKIQNVVQILK